MVSAHVLFIQVHSSWSLRVNSVIKVVIMDLVKYIRSCHLQALVLAGIYNVGTPVLWQPSETTFFQCYSDIFKNSVFTSK